MCVIGKERDVLLEFLALSYPARIVITSFSNARKISPTRIFAAILRASEYDFTFANSRANGIISLRFFLYLPFFFTKSSNSYFNILIRVAQLIVSFFHIAPLESRLFRYRSKFSIAIFDIAVVFENCSAYLIQFASTRGRNP